MHYNKIKDYFNFHISNLKLLKNKIGPQIIFISEQYNERNYLKQY